MTHPNPSTAQARVVVDELHRQGVEYAVVSPGSRSSSLALAVDGHPGIETRVILDERSAAFHALGRARVTGIPTVAICTSGTAVANYLPAVVEADLSMVPLILLSADRPPDLLHVGANQTIEQARIFGERTRWYCDIPAGDAEKDWNVFWRTSVSQAVARSLGHGGIPGPVHLNIAFREPTVPVPDDGRARAAPYPHSTEGRALGAPWQRHMRARPGPGVIPEPPGDRPLLIVGEGDFHPSDLARAAGLLGWPVLATAMSGVRGGEVVTTYHHLLVDGVPPSLRPNWLLVVGRIGPSDRLAGLTGLDVPRVHIDNWGVWHDPRRSATHLLQADPVPTLETLRPSEDPGFRDAWARADTAMRAALDNRLREEGAPTGPAVARALGSVDFDRLVAASSMPVRDVDAHTVRPGMVFANRGASGIDGLVSTTLGVASVGGRTVALAGDLSLLHDAGGLIVDRLGDVVFVVIDNGGGGLFDLLPQAEHAPGFERLFITPHGLDLRQLASAYRLGSWVVDRVDDLAARVTESVDSGGPHVVVVPVDRENDLKLRRSLDDVARAVCSDIS